jgi:hypothetical protein
LPAVIGVHPARHDDLRAAGADVPLWRPVAVAGVSGSGKTPPAIGTPCAKGPVPVPGQPALSGGNGPDHDRLALTEPGADRAHQDDARRDGRAS